MSLLDPLPDLPDHPLPTELAEEIAKLGVASLVPGVGPSLAVAIGYVRQRRNQQQIVAFLSELRDRINNLPQLLRHDDAFASLLIRAVNAARDTHHESKRTHLRNALESAASDRSDPDRQEFFLLLVEVLLPDHVLYLKFLRWEREATIDMRVPQLPGQFQDNGYLRAIVATLQAYGLAEVRLEAQERGFGGTDWGGQRMHVREGSTVITSLGSDFLSFITLENTKAE